MGENGGKLNGWRGLARNPGVIGVLALLLGTLCGMLVDRVAPESVMPKWLTEEIVRELRKVDTDPEVEEFCWLLYDRAQEIAQQRVDLGHLLRPQ